MNTRVTLLATLILFATALFAQSKKDMETDYAKCVSARDSIQNAYGDLSKSFESLSKTYDSIHGVSVAYDSMYSVLKEKVIHRDFAPTEVSVLIDSLNMTRRAQVSGLSNTLNDTIAALKKENASLKAQIVPADDKTQIVEDLKKLKELLDAGIITQQEFDTKKAALLEKF